MFRNRLRAGRFAIRIEVGQSYLLLDDPGAGLVKVNFDPRDVTSVQVRRSYLVRAGVVIFRTKVRSAATCVRFSGASRLIVGQIQDALHQRLFQAGAELS